VRSQPRLAADIETACFRIVQEALTNIARHAQAKQVEIRLDRHEDRVILRITDDGCGFNIDQMRIRAVAGDSIGVLGMLERATLVGGELTIESTPGQGCTVQFSAPWRTHEDLL
jgi:signal transduction histidine kinase